MGDEEKGYANFYKEANIGFLTMSTNPVLLYANAPGFGIPSSFMHNIHPVVEGLRIFLWFMLKKLQSCVLSFVPWNDKIDFLYDLISSRCCYVYVFWSNVEVFEIQSLLEKGKPRLPY